MVNALVSIAVGLLVALVVGMLDYWVKGVGYFSPLTGIAVGCWLYTVLK